MNSIFNDPGFWHRLQFGFTIVASSPGTLRLASFCWPVGFALAVFYFIFISRRYAGKVSLPRDTQGFYSVLL